MRFFFVKTLLGQMRVMAESREEAKNKAKALEDEVFVKPFLAEQKSQQRDQKRA